LLHELELGIGDKTTQRGLRLFAVRFPVGHAMQNNIDKAALPV
jgi:hypothetical protein